MPEKQRTKAERQAVRRAEREAEKSNKLKKQETDRRNRRFLIGSLLFLGGAGAIGGASVFLNQTARPETDDEIAKRLHDLDTKISKNPNILTDSASEITEMAAYSFHRETARRAIDPKEVFEVYSDSRKFIERANATSECQSSRVDPGTGGLTDRRSQRIMLNLGLILQIAASNAAIETFIAAKHELGHFLVEGKPITSDFATLVGLPLPLDGFKTFGFAVEKKMDNGCLTVIPEMAVLEEVTVQDKAERAARQLSGYERYSSSAYRTWVTDFRDQLITPYFGDRPTLPFDIQGESHPFDLFREIGKRGRSRFANNNLTDEVLGFRIVGPFVKKHAISR